MPASNPSEYMKMWRLRRKANGLDSGRGQEKRSYRDRAEYQRDYMRNYQRRHEVRQRGYARAAVRRALLSGKLIRESCRICGNPKSEAHHEDYTKRLEVVWLCRKHHEETHAH